MAVNYHEYIRSAAWAEVRNNAIRRAGGKCEACGSTECLQAHHKSYVRLGCETVGDLLVVCDNCHKRIHDIIGRRRVNFHLSTAAFRMVKASAQAEKKAMRHKQVDTLAILDRMIRREREAAAKKRSP